MLIPCISVAMSSGEGRRELWPVREIALNKGGPPICREHLRCLCLVRSILKADSTVAVVAWAVQSASFLPLRPDARAKVSSGSAPVKLLAYQLQRPLQFYYACPQVPYGVRLKVQDRREDRAESAKICQNCKSGSAISCAEKGPDWREQLESQVRQCAMKVVSYMTETSLAYSGDMRQK